MLPSFDLCESAKSVDEIPLLMIAAKTISSIIHQPIDLAASKPAVVANALLEFTDFGFKASNRLLGLG